MWVKRHSEDVPEGEFLSTIPEVRRVLEEHLDSNVETSAAVRSVYGHYFPWIFLIEAVWAESLVPLIFPEESALAYLRSAAWEAYLIWNSPYDSSFRLLKGQYRAAVASLGAPALWRWHGAHDGPEVSLARHLLAYYWRGLIGLDTADHLLKTLYQKASIQLRGRAMSSVGFSFSQADSPSPAAVERLQALWNWRLQETSSEGAEGCRELANFAWWLRCPCFPDEWLMNQLERLLERGCSLDPPSEGFAFLQRYVSVDPARAIDALGALLRLERQGWGIMGSRDDIMSTLRVGLACNDEVRQRTVRIVGWLGSVGYSDYRSLVEGNWRSHRAEDD
jgi:hypothetical protein